MGVANTVHCRENSALISSGVYALCVVFFVQISIGIKSSFRNFINIFI
ncbi:hypothetical protein UYO_1161 [Lachnospiraceae bacterium JC7]|nr:hypothetical protein UYO_1161 [Lachnospiraceae bacterium JC7]